MGTADSEKERKLWFPTAALSTAFASQPDRGRPGGSGSFGGLGSTVAELKASGKLGWDASNGKGDSKLTSTAGTGASFKRGEQLWTIVQQLIFLGTGVFSTICNQVDNHTPHNVLQRTDTTDKPSTFLFEKLTSMSWTDLADGFLRRWCTADDSPPFISILPRNASRVCLFARARSVIA